MTATICLGICVIILLLNLASSLVFCRHLEHERTSIAFPEFTILGSRREPHSLQKSIQPTHPLGLFFFLVMLKDIDKYETM
jgi:hypothetical protein